MAQDLIEKIRAAAQAKGVDPEVAVSIARAESGLDPNAKAKSSTASGLFQILNSTWSGNKGAPGKQFDSDENIRVGTDIISQNVNSLKKFLGRDPSPKEVYAAHYFGATGAQKFLTAAPDTPAKQLFSEKVLAANPNLQGKTAAQISAQLEGKLKIPASNVPRETMAKKDREPLPPSLPPMAEASPEKATTVASASKGMPDIKNMPASYQAAFALAALADAKDDEKEFDENKETEAEKLMREYKPVNHLASLDLSVTPVMMKDGGEVDAEEKRPDDIKYFSNVNRMKDRGVTTDSVMLGARTKAGEGSVIAGLNMANMSKDEKMQTARALMLAYTQQDPEGLGFSANVVKPQGAPAMANLMGSLPVGEGRVSAGVHGNQAYSLGYNRPVEGGQFSADLNVPRGTMGSSQLNLRYDKRFKDGGEVGEDLTKPSFVNPNIRKQGEAARRLAAMRDVNTLPDPKTYAAVAGALGTRPDQMGFSVLNPKYKEIMDVANPAFYAGTALQIAPVAQGPGMGRMVGAAERALEPAVRRTLEGGGKASEMLQALAAPPSQMFVRARPEAAARHADLQAKGLSPEEIRAQNLTLVDNRGNLIEEISDAPAVLQQKTASVPRNFYEMLKHPELESIYPTYDMPQVMMETTKRKGAPLAMGNFDVQNNMISGRIRDLPEDDARSMVRGTVLHEGQHAIQSAEGFTEGANPGAFIAYVQARQGKYNADPTVNENVIREMERAYPNIGSVADNLSMRLQADKYMRYAVGDPDRYVGETLYRHMPGEVQAELARVRSNLTPEQLKATPLEVSMQQLGVDPKNILEMNKMGSRPDRYIGDVEYDPTGYADGGPVYRAEGSPMTSERKLDRETIALMRGERMQPEAMTRVRPPLELNPSAAGLPGLMMYNDPSLPGTGTAGYVMVGDDNAKNPAMAQAMFLNPKDGNKADTIAHETEHLLARQNLGRGSNINTKFDELIGDNGLKRIQFVQKAVQVAPYLKEKYGLESAYFQPEMVEFQGRRAKNLLYEQLASLAALEQRHKIDLTKDEELRKTLFARPDVRETYNALTGLRQTRLDPRDLPPHTRVPEPGMLDAVKKVFKRADGGMVYRADGSPEEGERLTPQQIERIAAQESAEREALSTPAFIAQKSGIGRKAGPVSQALQSGQGQIEFLKGMTNVPQNILGAPMDISNMIANVYGGGVEKPFMGSEYIKEGLRAKGLGFTPSTDPTLAAFYGAGDLGSNLVNPAGATRTGVKAAEKTGEAAKMLARDFQGYNQQLAAPGASYAMKPKGGHYYVWPESSAAPEKSQVDAYLQMIENRMEKPNAAVADWVKSKVGRYIRSDFATEQDQMVKAAEEGKKLHFTTPRAIEESAPIIDPSLTIMRKTEGFPPQGFAKTEQGRMVEDIVDSSVWPATLENTPTDYIPSSIRKFKDTDPNMRVYELPDAVFEDNLKITDLANQMDKMMTEKTIKLWNQDVPVPKEYQLDVDTLKGLTPAQASNRVAMKEEWLAKKEPEVAGQALAKDPQLVSHRYDNGSKWISPADLSENDMHRQMVNSIGCRGGWCTDKDSFALDYGSGDNRLHILLDKGFQPRAQLTMSDRQGSLSEFLAVKVAEDPNYNSDLFENLQNARASGNQQAVYDAMEEFSRLPEYLDWSRKNNIKQITEIKGQFNKEDLTNQPYLKEVQDFVKRQGPELQSVENLDGIGMTDISSHIYPNKAFKAISAPGKKGMKDVYEEAIKINGNSAYIEDDPAIIDSLIEKAVKNVFAPKPLSAARQIQMNFFELPKEKAHGGMIERQPNDNRRYL